MTVYTRALQLRLIKCLVREAEECTWEDAYTDRALTACITTPVNIDLPDLPNDGDVDDEDDLSDSERVRLGLDYFEIEE